MGIGLGVAEGVKFRGGGVGTRIGVGVMVGEEVVVRVGTDVRRG